MKRPRWLVPLLLLAPACALLPGGAGEEPPSRDAEGQEELPVVDDTGPFDPAEAVDDDDAPVVAVGTEKDPTDQDPFVDEPRPDEGRADGESPAEERAEDEPEGRAAAHAADEPTRTGTEPGENERERADERPAGERVASPQEVRELEEARTRKLEEIARADGDDEEAKAELARNPPPEPLPEPDPIERAALAWVMEGLVLALVAGVLTALWRFARHYPKTVGAVALAGVALVGFFLSQSA